MQIKKEIRAIINKIRAVINKIVVDIDGLVGYNNIRSWRNGKNILKSIMEES